MREKLLAFLFASAIVLSAGCQAEAESLADAPAQPATSGQDRGMRNRHMASVPEEYASLSNPIEPSDESLGRGLEVYESYCERCHGETGMGEGPDGATASPAPAPVAYTSERMTDAYLYWRNSEGGFEEPFNSIMLPWKGTLDEPDRWHVINFMRAMGRNMAGRGAGGGRGQIAIDPTVQAEQHAAMMAQGLADGVITEAEAELFTTMHELVDALRATEEIRGPVNYVLDILVSRDEVTRADADAFLDIHGRLEEAGLTEK